MIKLWSGCWHPGSVQTRRASSYKDVAISWLGFQGTRENQQLVTSVIVQVRADQAPVPLTAVELLEEKRLAWNRYAPPVHVLGKPRYHTAVVAHGERRGHDRDVVLVR